MSRSILIVDDQSDFRSSARALLATAGFEVVGEAADGSGALEAAARLRPDLVLLDVQLPDLDGFEVAARLAQSSDPPGVILTSTRSASSYRRRLGKSSALGFIGKGDLSRETLAALCS